MATRAFLLECRKCIANTFVRTDLHPSVAPKPDEQSGKYECRKQWRVAPPTNHAYLIYDITNEYLICPSNRLVALPPLHRKVKTRYEGVEVFVFMALGNVKTLFIMLERIPE